jgi:hypothetical protein
MRISSTFLLLLGLVYAVVAQDAPRTIQDLIGVWDIYMENGKEIIGEFSASSFGKSAALQTRFVLPSMNSEVNGIWVYDAEIKAISVFEVTNTGQFEIIQVILKNPKCSGLKDIPSKNRLC